MKNSQTKRGRPAGSQNKVSLTLKTRINLFLDRNLDNLQEEYDQLESKDKLNFIRDLMPYIVPKLSAVAADVEIRNKFEAMSEEQLNLLITNILEQDDEQDPAD
jgi:hypothetical protein